MKYTNKGDMYKAKQDQRAYIHSLFITKCVYKSYMAVQAAYPIKDIPLFDWEGEVVQPWTRRKSYDRQTKLRKSRRTGLLLSTGMYGAALAADEQEIRDERIWEPNVNVQLENKDLIIRDDKTAVGFNGTIDIKMAI